MDRRKKGYIEFISSGVWEGAENFEGVGGIWKMRRKPLHSMRISR